MTETSAQKAKRFMLALPANSKASVPAGDVRVMLNDIAQTNSDTATCRGPASATDVRRGDVFIAKITGGKVRPWIVLRKQKDIVMALAMSSGDSAPLMTQAKCRFWSGSWIGSTLSMFSLEVACLEITRPYTNLKHLREVEKNVADAFGLHVKQCQKTVTDIKQIIDGMRPETPKSMIRKAL